MYIIMCIYRIRRSSALWASSPGSTANWGQWEHYNRNKEISTGIENETLIELYNLVLTICFIDSMQFSMFYFCM